MQFLVGSTSDLPRQWIHELAQYRHRVFVERLGWQLQGEPGIEFDAFDRPDTVYVIARGEHGRIVGCSRLLPTTAPYLLSHVFPELLEGCPPPGSPQIWELSRFAALKELPGIYRALHVNHPLVEITRVRSMKIEGESGARVHLDGESFGTIPVEISAFPGALRVACSTIDGL